MSDPWLSADAIASHLGVTKDTVYAWIADKDMPAHKVGRLWKFQASEVDEWVRSGSAATSGQDATGGAGERPRLSLAEDDLSDLPTSEREGD